MAVMRVEDEATTRFTDIQLIPISLRAVSLRRRASYALQMLSLHNLSSLVEIPKSYQLLVTNDKASPSEN
jgi:hypothetical protein